MVKVLNIVNGDIAIKIIKNADIQGDFLPWSDFLHEGSVPYCSSLEELSEIRINFIEENYSNSLVNIREKLEKRDEKLKNYHKYQKIILWFEHDLYDQLQLLQILSWFGSNSIENSKLTLVSTDNYLGESSKNQIRKLLGDEETITKEHLELAKKAWSAFRERTPKSWFKLLEEDTHLLPFLKNAIIRMIEEYPNTRNGLSRSEYQALFSISKGIENPKDIFTNCQNYEKQKFMGEIIFWKILDDFIENELIKSKKNGQILQITTLGKKILNGEINYLHTKNIERCIGGVKLTNDSVWCWDIDKKSIDKYYYSKTLSTLLKFR